MKISQQKNYGIRNQMMWSVHLFPQQILSRFLCNAFFLCNGINTNGKIKEYLTFFL